MGMKNVSELTEKFIDDNEIVRFRGFLTINSSCVAEALGQIKHRFGNIHLLFVHKDRQTIL